MYDGGREKESRAFSGMGQMGRNFCPILYQSHAVWCQPVCIRNAIASGYKRMYPTLEHQSSLIDSSKMRIHSHVELGRIKTIAKDSPAKQRTVEIRYPFYAADFLLIVGCLPILILPVFLIGFGETRFNTFVEV